MAHEYFFIQNENSCKFKEHKDFDHRNTLDMDVHITVCPCSDFDVRLRKIAING